MWNSWLSFSLWSHHKRSSAIQCKVNQHMHVLRGDQQAEQANQCSSSHCLWDHIYTPSSWVLSCVYYIQTFFPMSALARHPFTCVPQQNIIWQNWFSKETRKPHFTLPLNHIPQHPTFLGVCFIVMEIKPRPHTFKTVYQLSCILAPLKYF